MEETNDKNCLACGKPLQGRADKKFCDDYCRNAYHNKSKALDIKIVRNINNALRKNRNILEEILKDEDTARANQEKLLSLGFNFKYQTHTYTTKKGHSYIYCYEYGYLPLENNWYLIVKNKED